MRRIALNMLMGDKAKFYSLVIGIAFATFLMAQQVTTFQGVMDRTASQIIDVHEANIWVMDPLVRYIDEIRPMRDIDLQRVRSVPGVIWAVPFYKGFANMRVPGFSENMVMLMASDDSTLIGKPPRIVFGSWNDLTLPNALIIDEFTWKLIWGNEPYHAGKVIEMNNKRHGSNNPYFSEHWACVILP